MTNFSPGGRWVGRVRDKKEGTMENWFNEER